MNELFADVAVLGSGFGGSLTALLLKQAGLGSVLIDRGCHPRFAIGESSTPIADYVLADLASKYNLPRLMPLTKYGTWQATYPQITCGIKRGFSYFHHQPGKLFQPRTDHTNELLVTASTDDDHSDTHWLRADVDAFFAGEAQAAGIPLLERTVVSPSRERNHWILTGERRQEPVQIRAQFIVDASGEAGVLQRTLAIPGDADRLTTNSRALFSHFAGVIPWQDVLAAAGGTVNDHPFPCDHAALHHVVDEGWMWQLRFNNGRTSAGFMLDAAALPLDEGRSPDAEWTGLLERYPSIRRQFAGAAIVSPPGRLVRTNRVQRMARQFVGTNWAMLPHTAGFIDPLHSTGIAQTLCGVERLVHVLSENWNASPLAEALQCYEDTLRQEFMLIDRLVSGCYLARRHHRLFTAFAMLYFAAATTYEHRRCMGTPPANAPFLCADDDGFRRVVDDRWDRLQSLIRSGNVTDAELDEFETELRAAIEPYNHVGLCDPSAKNMYRYTAAPKA